MKIAAIQLNLSQNKEKNLKKITSKIAKAAQNGANLVVLQELHNSIYFPYIEDVNFFDLAETIPGPSTKYFGSLAKKFKVVIVISLFEERASGLYHNSAVVLEKTGEIAGIYRKMHIPDDPGFYEKFYFTPGDLGFRAINTSIGKLGVLICWDQWYPEAARLMALNGAQILIYPTAIGWDMSDSKEERARQLNSWITIQQSHAIANNIPVVVANRVKKDEKIKNSSNFWGNSFICSGGGEILAKASSNKEEIIYATIDKQETQSLRRIWPFFRDRRIECYYNLTKRWND
jgi:N-carbamoylputrescine amidase